MKYLAFFTQFILEIVAYVISVDFSLANLTNQITIIYRQLCESYSFTPFPPEKLFNFLFLAVSFLSGLANTQ